MRLVRGVRFSSFPKNDIIEEDRSGAKTMFAIEVKGLVKIYDSKTRALDGIDLQITPGKLFAFLGPNGAGKTTLMRILTTQLRPTSGQAVVFDQDVVKKASGVRKLIGYVPQEMSVWTDVTGFENLLIYAKIYGVPAKSRNREIREALAGMGLAGVAGELVHKYSGGMIRRLEVACAMVVKPRILFLDEPTIGLDPAARKAVWDKILVFKREYGTTVFFNTHYMDEADLYSDEIAIIDQGRMVKLGTAEELKRSIGKETIHLILVAGDPDDRVVKAIKKLPFVSGITRDNSGITIMVGNAEATLPAVIEAVRTEGIPLAGISATKPTLDDVFLAYAGSSLSSGSGERDARSLRGQIRKG